MNYDELKTWILEQIEDDKKMQDTCTKLSPFYRQFNGGERYQQGKIDAFREVLDKLTRSDIDKIIDFFELLGKDASVTKDGESVTTSCYYQGASDAYKNCASLLRNWPEDKELVEEGLTRYGKVMIK